MLPGDLNVCVWNNIFPFQFHLNLFTLKKKIKDIEVNVKKIKMNVTLGEKTWEDTLWLHFEDFKCVYMSNTLCSANSKLVSQLHNHLKGY